MEATLRLAEIIGLFGRATPLLWSLPQGLGPFIYINAQGIKAVVFFSPGVEVGVGVPRILDILILPFLLTKHPVVA